MADTSLFLALGVAGLTITARRIASNGTAFGADVACPELAAAPGAYMGTMAGTADNYGIVFYDAGGNQRAWRDPQYWTGTEWATEGALYVITASLTFPQLMRGVSAALLGTLSGANVGLPVFRDIANTKNVISAVTDQAGNRQTVTLDLTP
jgi:hypothetical protein